MQVFKLIPSMGRNLMKLISLKRILKNTKMSIKKDSINILENLVKMKDRLEIQGKSIINLKLFHVLRLMD
jgi:hypothetical protein